MIKTIKINEDTYEYVDVSCQLSLGAHADIYISLDLKKHPGYKAKIISLFESNNAFIIISTKFVSKSNLIKLMDIDSDKITLNIRSEILETISKDERRDDVINDILDDQSQTFSI
jgi:hypothetical protein